jgi:hypothetical protein
MQTCSQVQTTIEAFALFPSQKICEKKQVLVLCQRKTGSGSVYGQKDDPEKEKKNVEKSVKKIENYTREFFAQTENIHIEYLSQFPRGAGTADYNFTFGDNVRTLNFVNKNREKYDLVILYTAPFVVFVQNDYMYGPINEILKPNSFVCLFQLSRKNPQENSWIDFTGWNQHFQEVQGVNDELMYITI